MFSASHELFLFMYVQTNLRNKVNASDIASLMPSGTGGDDASAVMPKLLELQTKLNGLEGIIIIQSHSDCNNNIHVQLSWVIYLKIWWTKSQL